MAKRFTDTEKWKKPFIRSLQAPYKLLYLYILDDCDHAGIWQVDFDVAKIRIGEPSLNEMQAVVFFGEKIQVLNGGEKWFIPAFIEFQYGILNPKNKVHESVLKIHSKLKIKPHTSPLQGAKEKDKEKEMDKEEEKESGEKFLVPQILQNWYQTFPTYTKSKTDDFPAVLRIISFMMQQHGIPNMNEPDAREKILGTFEAVSQEIHKDQFWINKPLKSIANNIQEFYNKIKNPQNGSHKQSSSRQAANKQSIDYLLGSISDDIQRSGG